MLKSAADILKEYIPISHWFSFQYFELIDIEVEERAYICKVNNRWFLVYEADFLILDLPKLLEEIAYIFEDYSLTPLHWLARNQQGLLPLTDSVENDKTVYDKMIYKSPTTHFVYATLEVKRA
jgi:hypothetical protein